ncbi:Glucokinase [Arenibacter antarcticus]|uniref:ROK family protein n=1 Tax=Arenibacter antarcticus TaxID=2040469 RepID=A0ABW5VKJ0_9FLAO|nr:ROK family protein [Arenibacter sp. H213]MCM4169117.1 glucokinase [Arenibacter sp. H213]
MEKWVLAIDVGGTFTKLGLVNAKGDILGAKVYDTGAKLPYKDFLSKLGIELRQLLSTHGKGIDVVAAGVGAPNANMHTGQMEDPPNFNWGTRVPLAKSIEDMCNLPTTIANDANAAALGEMTFGMARGMKNFVVLTLGTGLGSGIIINGELLTGENGMAGEIGHVNVDPHGRKCNCGLTGCLENYASVTGLKRTVFELISEMREESTLKQISFDDLTGVMIADAAHNGDPIALKAFQLTGEVLGSKMADTAAHLDPEAFILTGGLGKAGDLLLKPTIASMEKNLFIAYRGSIKVNISTAPSSHAILGPAALAFHYHVDHS